MKRYASTWAVSGKFYVVQKQNTITKLTPLESANLNHVIQQTYRGIEMNLVNSQNSTIQLQTIPGNKITAS
jgi:hypothetical protein